MTFSVRRLFNKNGDVANIQQVSVESMTNIRDYSEIRYVEPSFRAFKPTIPGLREGGLSNEQLTNLNDYLLQFSSQSSKSIHVMEIDGPANVTRPIVSTSAVYVPTLNRIYFIPGGVLLSQYVYYIDCNTGLLEDISNTSGTSFGLFAYNGGAYAPNLNRVYLAPYGQSDETKWHYIDGVTGDYIAYTHGVTLDNNAYTGIVYAPTLDRLYLIPSNQSSESNWHYIDGSTGDVVAYAHEESFDATAFQCGAYSPTEDRIYLIPRLSSTTEWYYINGTTGSVELMSGLFPTILNDFFTGAVYAPTLNRIYLIPGACATRSVWYYIDCTSGLVEEYIHGTTGVTTTDYHGGVYSPVHNRIYFVPMESAINNDKGHYIDCDDGSVHSYTSNVSHGQEYMAGVYSPTENRIYFARNGSVNERDFLIYLNELSRFRIDRGLMAHSMFGSYS
jgi:hypothetical protein